MAIYDLAVDFLLDADAVGTGEPDDHCGGLRWWVRDGAEVGKTADQLLDGEGGGDYDGGCGMMER